MSYKKQHIIPEAYLKYFATNSKVNVIQLNNEYRRNIQEKGIGDKIFCDYENFYYNYPNSRNEPVLEKMFGRIESNDYETIMTNVHYNTDLGFETKNIIINWLLMMKMRSSFFRDTFSNNIAWAERTKSKLKARSNISDLEEKEINATSKTVAKAIQLSAFLDDYQKTLKEYFVNFMYKDWSILKSDSINFITSDNPGFSVSLSMENFSKGINPVSSNYNLDRKNQVIHYFPLSKRYCLSLIPIFRNIEEDKINELTHSQIEIEVADTKKVQTINEMTIQTSHKLIIGNEFSDLENWIETIKQRFK